jgi:hypothetical protein
MFSHGLDLIRLTTNVTKNPLWHIRSRSFLMEVGGLTFLEEASLAVDLV